MFQRLLQNPNRVVASAFLIALLSWLAVMWPHRHLLEVTFLDVGQGDCAVVKTPTGRIMLIDGGGIPEGNDSHFDVGDKIVLPYLRRHNIRRIDIMALSHPHEDHLAGLVSVLEQMHVGSVIEPSTPHASPVYSRFLNIIQRKGISRITGRRGMRIKVDQYTVVDVLNPAREEAEGLSTNDNSMALLLSCRGARVLFAGDCEQEAEASMCASVADLKADVLKAGHHGSANATGNQWLNRVQPQIVIISMGKNNQFGHPSPLTLKRLEASGCRVYRTDAHGAVRITVDGRKISVRTFASER